MKSTRFFKPLHTDDAEHHYQKLLAKQDILQIQIKNLSKMIECKRNADLTGKPAEFRENKYTKQVTELTETVECYEQRKIASEAALARLMVEIANYREELITKNKVTM